MLRFCPKVVLNLLLFSSFLFLTADRTYAREWLVDEGESVQDAIDAAADGDVIKIGPGEFHETLRLEFKSLALEGAGMGETFLVGNASLEPLLILGGQQGGVEVLGLTFDCSSSCWPTGLKIDHVQGAFIHNNHFTHCPVGVSSYFSSVRFENNLFTFNRVGGYFAEQGGEGGSLIQSNTFYGNIYFGLILDNPPLVFRWNIVAGNTIVGLTIWGDGDEAEVSFNDFWGNGCDTTGVDLDDSNLSVDPLFINPESGNFGLQEGSPLIDAGGFEEREGDGTRVDLGFEGRVQGSISDPMDASWLVFEIIDFASTGERPLVRSNLFKPLVNKLLAVRDLILEGELHDASKKVTHDLLPKFDLENKNAWVEDTPWRRRFHLLLSDLVILLEME